jgi:hypothetical protein
MSDTIEHAGLTFRVTVEHDSDHGAPWEECEGHGPVSEFRRHYRGDTDKRPGEVVLHSDGRSSIFYDWQEATRIAKRDGWGLGDAEMEKLAAKLKRAPTRGEIVAEAVRRDFDYLRRWCSNDWYYVGVIVTLLDADGDETHESESLWGIESESTDYLAEVAKELADEIVHRIGDASTLHIHTNARDTTIRLRA